MTKQASKQTKHQWLGVVFWYGALIWAHGETQQQAADACAKQAKHSLKQYLKRGQKVEWNVNLYEVHDQDWTYDDETGFVLADGRRALREDCLKVTA